MSPEARREPRSARNRRASTSVAERFATGLAVIGILAIVAVFLFVRSSSSGIGSRPRSAAEQSQLLASGDCALRPDRTMLGKVAARLGPTRSLPRGGYLLESIDRHRIFQVQLDEATLVPCRSLAH
jgi:hypothetical protein